MPDSSTGGYLAPSPAPAPLEGLALLQFLQAWVVGITGMDGTLVRPRWQPEPPDIPQAGDAWCAFGITRRPSDQYPYVGFDRSTLNYTLQRHEELVTLASFYDLGSTGQADYLAALFRDGAAIPQNREVLGLAGMGLVRVGELIALPSLLKLRWLYRVDVECVIRREIDRQYQVLSILTAHGDIYTDGGLPPQPF